MKMATPSIPGGVPGYPPPIPMAAPGGRRVSGGLLFLFTLPIFPSGVNYMFMGLIKRGLAALCSFFLLIYMIVISSGPITVMFALALPIFWLTCAFDGFQIRRRINAGEHVPDSIDEAINFLRANKWIVWIIAIMVGLSVLGTVVGIIMNIVRWLLPFIIIGLGLYVLFKRRPPAEPPQR